MLCRSWLLSAIAVATLTSPAMGPKVRSERHVRPVSEAPARD